MSFHVLESRARLEAGIAHLEAVAPRLVRGDAQTTDASATGNPE